MWWVWGSPISIWKKCPFELLVDLIICNKYVIANVLRFLTSMKDWSFHGSAIIFLKPLLGYQVGLKPEAVVYFGFVQIFLPLWGWGGGGRMQNSDEHSLITNYLRWGGEGLEIPVQWMWHNWQSQSLKLLPKMKNRSHVPLSSLVFSGLQSIFYKLSSVAEIFSPFPTKATVLGNLKAKNNYCAAHVYNTHDGYRYKCIYI